MKKFNEIASMSIAEIQHELAKSLKDLHELRLGNALKQLKETHKIRVTRRYIAQLKTALRQDQKGILSSKPPEREEQATHAKVETKRTPPRPQKKTRETTRTSVKKKTRKTS